MATAYLANASVGPMQVPALDGKPLVAIFDGTGACVPVVHALARAVALPTSLASPLARATTYSPAGADHSNLSHPNFTLRWMASQDQDSHFNDRGYWSWMDGAIDVPITPSPTGGGAEAATIAPAFFADGGWLAPTAVGQRGGLSLLEEFAALLNSVGVRPATDGTTLVPAIEFILLSQWAEYAGQPNGGGYGPNHDIYVDSYSAELSNELEPTSMYACAYRRPGIACGAWGMRNLNTVGMLVDAVQDVTALDEGVVAVAITSPTLGATVTYVDPTNTSIAIGWQVLGFNSTGIASGPQGWLTSPAVAASVTINGQQVATAPAGVLTATLPLNQVTGLNRAMPLVVTVTLTGAGSTTRYPLSSDVFDEAVPLATPVPATATIIVHLPEWQ